MGDDFKGRPSNYFIAISDLPFADRENDYFTDDEKENYLADLLYEEEEELNFEMGV